VPDPAPQPTTTSRALEVDRNGLEVLDPVECARLLASATFGRIGITVSALPTILPINYRLVDRRIVFRTAPGTKLDAATRGAVVAFEVDSIDPLDHSGWSVVVTGVANEVTDPADLAELERAQIPRWAPSPQDRIVELPLHMVSGRRLRPGGPWSHRTAPDRP
jgi:hypothetical protein